MRAFLRDHFQLFGLILVWLATTLFVGPLLYLVLPVSVFLMHRKEMWPDMLFGFIIVLVVSDMDPAIKTMHVVKTAKYTYIVALSLIFLMDQARMQPHASVFRVFMPFFVFALLPIVRAADPFTAIQKTLSYALLYLVIPNYVLYAYRCQGWMFFKHLVLFLLAILLSQGLMPFIGPSWWSFVGGRFRGYFGNPNGLAIFCFLFFMLMAVLNHVKRDLFGNVAKALIYGVLIFFLIKCGSRTSIISTAMFVLFSKFFALSPFIGFVMFLAFLGISELVANNLPAFLTALGLQDYFRVKTLEDGSGRYFAWGFAWQKINEGGHFLIGGGFSTDEYVMRQNYPYLSRMGHQGGVHNSYLTLWFNTGVVGLILYLRSFLLIFFKANKQVPIAFAVMFSVLFSVMYESWLTGSLNPFTIILIILITVITEDEIVLWREREEEGQGEEAPPEPEEVPALILPAR